MRNSSLFLQGWEWGWCIREQEPPVTAHFPPRSSAFTWQCRRNTDSARENRAGEWLTIAYSWHPGQKRCVNNLQRIQRAALVCRTRRQTEGRWKSRWKTGGGWRGRQTEGGRLRRSNVPKLMEAECVIKPEERAPEFKSACVWGCVCVCAAESVCVFQRLTRREGAKIKRQQHDKRKYSWPFCGSDWFFFLSEQQQLLPPPLPSTHPGPEICPATAV